MNHGRSASGQGRGVVKLKKAQSRTHVTLPYCWDLRSAGAYISTAHRFSFHLHGWHTHLKLFVNTHTEINLHECAHMSHVTRIHILSSFHHKTLSFFPCCIPCKLLCCMLHRALINFVQLNFFFTLSLVTVLSLAYYTTSFF